MSPPPPPPPPPALKLQFASALHTVYKRHVPSDQVVVAPFLFGPELNVTIFHDLREEIQRIMREAEKQPGWSFESGTRPGHPLTVSLKFRRNSGAVSEVAKRICQYFSIDPKSFRVSLAYHRGGHPSRQSYVGGRKYVRGCVGWSPVRGPSGICLVQQSNPRCKPTPPAPCLFVSRAPFLLLPSASTSHRQPGAASRTYRWWPRSGAPAPSR